jgi:hypothetical protein
MKIGYYFVREGKLEFGEIYWQAAVKEKIN